MARVPSGAPRGRPKGCAKTGGRVAGKSLDRQARQLVSNELAGSILATFEQLGGTADMVSWARANRSIFYTQILSRLMPPAIKDDADFIQNNVQVNIDGMSEFEAARRVAFSLAKAAHDQGIDITTQEAVPRCKSPDAPREAYSPNRWMPDAPVHVCPVDVREPVAELERELEERRRELL